MTTELDLEQARSEALDEIGDAYWLVADDGRWLDANREGRALLDALGGPEAALAAPGLCELLAGGVPARARIALEIEARGLCTFAVRSFRPEGGRAQSGQPGQSGGKAKPVAARVLLLRDRTAQEQAEREQSRLANYDSLTGLPNRRLFERQLEAALESAQASGRVVALVLLDLDHFKQTNDSMGHAAGDELLAFVAEAIRGVVRGRDVVGRLGARPDEPDVARLGGDEFAIILRDVARSEDSTDIAARVLAALHQRVEIQGTPVLPSASIGVAVHPTDATDARGLTIAADQALYRAKELGRNQVQLYHPMLNERASHRRELARELARALEQDGLEVVYEPLVGLCDGEVRGAEARVRWVHPTLGETPHAVFVEIAEKTGLADRLGRWTLERVLTDMAKHAGADYDRRIALDISALELRGRHYVEQLEAQLAAHGVAPQQLVLEIPERTFLLQSEAVAANLAALRRLGVRLWLDDFGAGRASLWDLLEHRLDGVKLGADLVARHRRDRVAASVVRAVLQLAHELRLETVAQGVATPEEAVSLRRAGCEEGQGAQLARPLAAADYFAAVGRPAAELGPAEPADEGSPTDPGSGDA